MRTQIARTLGCDVPIFAFSHCRDVVVKVTKAGGFGVLGASRTHSASAGMARRSCAGNVAYGPKLSRYASAA